MNHPNPLSLRSVSMSSTTSSTSSASQTDLSSNARQILHTLCNDKDFSTSSPIHSYVASNVIVQHEDNDPVKSRDALIFRWQSTLQNTPNFHLDIKEACVDEHQMKVWVRSEITGFPNGVRKESIDMMQFNEEGLLTSSYDCQRVMKRRRDLDDDDNTSRL